MTLDFDRETFLSDMLITAVEGGVNYWAVIMRRDDLDPATGKICKDTLAHVRLLDREDQQTYDLDLNDVATGLRRACEAMTAGTIRDDEAFREACRTNGARGDFDAASATGRCGSPAPTRISGARARPAWKPGLLRRKARTVPPCPSSTSCPEQRPPACFRTTISTKPSRAPETSE